MTSPPPYVDAAGPALAAWFPLPDAEAWTAEAERALRGRPLASLGANVPGLGRLPVFVGEHEATVVPGFRQGAIAVLPVVDAASVDEVAAEVAAGWDRGAGGIGLVPDGALRGLAGREDGTMWEGLSDLTRALSTFQVSAEGGDTAGAAEIAVEAGLNPSLWLAALFAWADARGVARRSLRGAVHGCPWAVCARHGGAPRAEAWDDLAEAVRANTAEGSDLSVLSVDLRAIAEAGAGPVEMLAWALSATLETLRALDARGVAPDMVGRRVTARVPLGEAVFLQIALLRALRQLWAGLWSTLGHPAPELVVQAVGSVTEMTTEDVHNNTLRSTAAAVAAMLGGADQISVIPDDRLLGAPSARARRLATTGPVVLAAEARLDRLGDVGAGAGVIESLTARLRAAAWARMQEIEGAGGFSAAWAKGDITRAVEADRRAADGEVDRRARLVVGVTSSPAPAAPTEADGDGGRGGLGAPAVAGVGGERSVAASVAALRAGATFAELAAVAPRLQDGPAGLGFWRRAASWEALRRDARAARARVRLVIVGDGPMARARREFAAGVFAAGGFEIDPDAQAVCLCPSDEALADRSVAACLPGLGSAPFIALAAPPGADANALASGTTPSVVLLHRAADQRAALRQLLTAWEVA